MSREPRRMEKNVRESGKAIVYIAVAVIVAIVVISYVVVAIIMKGKNEVEIAKEDISNTQEKNTNAIVTTTDGTNNTANESNENTESASTSIGKTVEQSSEEATKMENKTESNADIKTENNVENNPANNNQNNAQTEDSTNMQSNISTLSPTDSNKENKNSEKTTTQQKEISFAMPIEGEIIRGFAKDNLVYSETLQEWIVHTALDIKAESRDVVKASAEGTVAAIKNDPRYGLTVIIEHDGGFKTVYSNLLTAEFVVEGEQVKQGQTIGTVGSSATFEIADESHLHFEMLKDSVYVDPSIYIK